MRRLNQVYTQAFICETRISTALPLGGALGGQVFLGNERLLESMERLLQGRPLDNVPRKQTLPHAPIRIGY
jgi:hypothetical protein